nr:hypothetical protein [Clostridium sp. AM51-4]
MIPEEMLSDELLRQATEKCAEAIIANLPAPEECNHKFSKRFEERCRHCSTQRPSAS